MSRGRIYTCATSSIVPCYHIALVYSNSTALSEIEVVLHKLTDIGIHILHRGDNPGVVLDRYLDREELAEVSLEEGIVFDDFQFFLKC
jgi:hypothetical protein